MDLALDNSAPYIVDVEVTLVHLKWEGRLTCSDVCITKAKKGRGHSTQITDKVLILCLSTCYTESVGTLKAATVPYVAWQNVLAAGTASNTISAF